MQYQVKQKNEDYFMYKKLTNGCAVVLLTICMPSYAIDYVDIELQLLVDISGSINTTEYDLQLQGYQAAFESNDVQNAIINGTEGQIAVQLIMWSGRNQQEVMIDWSLIDSTQSADAFASQVGALARPFSGMTAIGSAIEYAYPLFESNGFSGFSQIIDISGDGTKNSGQSIETAQANALDSGVDTINGIVITTSQSVIDQYYNEVVGGEDPFLLAADNFIDFQESIENKISAEIEGTKPNNIVSVPEPSTLYLLSLSLILFVCKPFSRGEKNYDYK